MSALQLELDFNRSLYTKLRSQQIPRHTSLAILDIVTESIEELDVVMVEAAKATA